MVVYSQRAKIFPKGEIPVFSRMPGCGPNALLKNWI